MSDFAIGPAFPLSREQERTLDLTLPQPLPACTSCGSTTWRGRRVKGGPCTDCNPKQFPQPHQIA